MYHISTNKMYHINTNYLRCSFPHTKRQSIYFTAIIWQNQSLSVIIISLLLVLQMRLV